MKLHEIHDAIKAVCPIVGINSDGAIDFDASATQQQKIDAQAIMNSELPNLILGKSASEEKWALVDAYEASLTVTLLNGHKYAVNKSARSDISEVRDSLIGLGADATEPWIEEWGTFSTNALELQEVLNEATNLIRIYRNLIFGV